MADTSVPQPTFGPSGFIVPSTQAILDGVFSDLQVAFGGNLNPSLSTPQGQLASSEAAVIADVDATFLYYTTQVDPAYAEGRMQDAIARIYFLERNPSQPTVVTATCTGLAGVVIPAGSLAIAEDGQQYACTDGGVISVSGHVDLTFACVVPGPVPCPAGSLNQIYRSIPGWDAINNAADGVIGNDVESRAAFEARRAASVAVNSNGSLPSVLGAVLSVSGVIDAYVTENTSNSIQVVGGVSLNPNSIYVAAVGGTDADVARAIWSRKAPGCAYNGNTSVTVQDTSPGYSPPYPTYTVQFERPDPLQVIFSVRLSSTPLVPSDAVAQVQAAIVAAFAGEDGGPRAKIGTELFASRFYAPVAALGSWVQIVSIEVGSVNAPAAVYAASIAGTVMTVTAVTSGTIMTGQYLVDETGLVVPGTTIASQLSGTPGGVGTYAVSTSQTVGAETMSSVTPSLFDVSVDIDQIPVTSAAHISVELV